MCGIVGYIGAKNAQEFVIDGLEKLEYRGYDSAGIAVNTGSEKFEIVKKVGRLKNLADELEKHPLKGTIAIGHTRWATHGKPSDENSHPHFNKDKTLVVAVRSGACKKEVFEGASGEVTKEKAAEKNLFTKIAEIVQEISESVNLEEAEVIVAGGRGMGSKENFELVKQLADVCGGVVGATRPATEDEWIPRSHQVGQSGKIVAPKLYIACGISGATQHISGIMGSDYIVAINKDEDAPIFDVADIGIVGNVMDIIPLMIEEIKKDFILEHVPNQYNTLTSDYNYLVVPDLKAFLEQHPNSSIFNQYYGGMNVTASEDEQLKIADDYSKFVNNFNRELNKEGSYVYGSNLADSSAQMSALFGGVFFIGIFLSIIFMVGTVLVIYYKQISEGYEDRERFIILQKVGLDQKQIKQTINKQVLTVFFLPLLFAFLHLAFAYHMLSLILKVIGVLDATMMLTVTLSICAIFLIVYVLIFMITSRSYRKIVQM